MRVLDQISFPQTIFSSIHLQVLLSIKPDDLVGMALGINTVTKSSLSSAWTSGRQPTQIRVLTC